MGACLGVESSEYVVYIRTGDKKNSGTDSNVWIILHNEAGEKTEEMKLDNVFRNDFEAGRLDTFPIKNLNVFGKVKKIEFWRDNTGLACDWFLDRIMVENVRQNEIVTFPVVRWINAHTHYHIHALDTALPQVEPEKNQRTKELDAKRQLYTYCQKREGLPSQVNKVLRF